MESLWKGRQASLKSDIGWMLNPSLLQEDFLSLQLSALVTTSAGGLLEKINTVHNVTYLGTEVCSLCEVGTLGG